MRVCITDGTAGPLGCVTDVTEAVTGSAQGIELVYNSGSELYQGAWKTDKLDKTLKYRIEVWGAAFTTAAQRAQLALPVVLSAYWG